MTFLNWLNDIAFWSIGFVGLAPLTVWPLLFHLYVIPNIEREIGGKIYRPMTLEDQFNVIPKYMRPCGDVALYIVMKYILSKVKKCPSTEVVILARSKMMLIKENYPVEKATRFMVFLSFLQIISHIWFFVGCALLFNGVIH